MIFGKAQTFHRVSVSALHFVNDIDYTMLSVETWPCDPDDFEIVINYCLYAAFGLLRQNRWPVPDIKQEHATRHQMVRGHSKRGVQITVCCLITDDVKKRDHNVEGSFKPYLTCIADIATEAS